MSIETEHVRESFNLGCQEHYNLQLAQLCMAAKQKGE